LTLRGEPHLLAGDRAGEVDVVRVGPLARQRHVFADLARIVPRGSRS
jgi:hypothetical protein